MNVHDDPKYQSGEPQTPDDITDSAIIVSPDTHRDNRIPPGQSRTRKWPVLHYAYVPKIDLTTWKLEIDGLVEQSLTLTLEDFRQLDRVKVFSDFHCVTRWSRLGNLWEGVSTRTILGLVKPLSEARFVVAEGYDSGWTTNLSLEDFSAPDALLAELHDDSPIDSDHGGPVRLVVPLLYAWKSAKWLRKITFVAQDAPGYWEQVGYHLRGDPWVVNDFHDDGERFRDDARWTGETPTL